MATKVGICNMALAHLGSSKPIQNVDTENSVEALACRTFFDIALDTVLRDFNWPFARRVQTLALFATYTNRLWRYAYAMPSDSVAIRKIQSGIMSEAHDQRIPYDIGFDGANQLILTNQSSATLEYTSSISNPAQLPSDFTMMFSLLLAAMIAPQVSGGDPFKNRERSFEMYRVFLFQARASAQNEVQAYPLPDSEFVRVR